MTEMSDISDRVPSVCRADCFRVRTNAYSAITTFLLKR